jgi:hypothetical protein
MTSDLSFTVMHPANTDGATTPYAKGLVRTLENTINQQFENFKDKDGVNVLRGTNIRLVAGQDNTATATLTVSVNKQLTEADYSIQFLEDISNNVTQTEFFVDVNGGVSTQGTYITYLNGAYPQSTTGIATDSMGVLSNTFDLSAGGGAGLYDNLSNNVFTSQFDTIKNPDFIIDTSYIAFIGIKDTVDKTYYETYYGISTRYGSTVPYGYLIPSPTIRDYGDINGLVSAINTQFSLFPDLNGTTLTISNISGTKYN